MRPYFNVIKVIFSIKYNTDLEKFLETNSKNANFKYFLEAVGGKSGMVKLNIDNNQSVLSSISSEEIGTTKQISFKEAKGS